MTPRDFAAAERLRAHLTRTGTEARSVAVLDGVGKGLLVTLAEHPATLKGLSWTWEGFPVAYTVQEGP